MQISEKRLAANRANAAHSTGPRSEEGKARSAQNALKHGISASKFTVAALDEADAFANMRADAIALYQPVDQQELFAVERVVLAQLAILRCAALEASMYSAALEPPTNEEGAPLPNPTLSLGRDLLRNSKAWMLLLRYKSQTDRQYRLAVEDLYRLKQLHAALPNEPTDAVEPEETTPLPTPIDRAPVLRPAPQAPSLPGPHATQPPSRPPVVFVG